MTTFIFTFRILQRMKTHLPVTIGMFLFATFAACGCAGQQPSSVYLVVPNSKSNNPLPSKFLGRNEVVEPNQIRGLLIENNQLFVIINLGDTQYKFAVAGAEVALGQEAHVLQRAAEATQYRWNLIRAVPVTTANGDLQIQIKYHTGVVENDLGSRVVSRR